MNINNKRRSVFGAIAIIAAILIFAALGYSGYRLNNHFSKSSTVTSKPTSSTQTGMQTQAADLYVGWKTYCDLSVEKACFEYPPNWTIDSSNQDGIASVLVKNPSGSVGINYTSADTRDGTTVPYYTVSIDDTATASSLKVVGGFFPAITNVTPRYKVVDQASTIGLTVGQQTSIISTARFTFKDHTTGHLEAYPINTNFNVSQAKNWFSTDDAKTVLLIMKSFYLE